MTLALLPGTQELSIQVEEATVSEDIAWALDQMKAKQADYRRYDDYYEGHHDLLFATEKFRNAFGHLFRAFADNLCPAVVDAPADRMKVRGFDGKFAPQATKFWQERKMPTASGQLFHETFKLGDGYLVVWPNSKGKATLWPQVPQQCSVEYDPDEMDRVIRGGKVWMVESGRWKHHWRVTLYYEDRIERFITNNKFPYGTPTKPSAFRAYSDDDAGSLIPNTWGVNPMFHFANNNSVGQNGRSVLKDVIPLQNALNKSVCDMLVAMEFVAMPQRWATGLQVEVDPQTGKPTNPPFVPGVDRVWTAGGDVKFGEFAQAQLEPFLTIQDNLRTEIARVSGAPLHVLMLGGNAEPPSGESQRTAEARIIKMVEDRQLPWGDRLLEGVLLGLRMENEVSDTATNLDLNIIWGGAQPNNPLFDAETALVKKNVGVSRKQSLRELGYSEPQVEQILKELEEEEAEKLQRETDRMEKLAKFQATNPTGGGSPAKDGGDTGKYGPGGQPTAYNRAAKPGQPSRTDPGGQVNQTRQAQRRRT